MMHRIKKAISIIITIAAICIVLLYVVFMVSLIIVNESGITDERAVKFVEKDLDIQLNKNTTTVVYSRYDTNFREEGYAVICDLNEEDKSIIIDSYPFEHLTIRQICEKGLLQKYYLDLLADYFDNDEEILLRYGADELPNGIMHIASFYVVAVSANGRLLLCVDP